MSTILTDPFGGNAANQSPESYDLDAAMAESQQCYRWLDELAAERRKRLDAQADGVELPFGAEEQDDDTWAKLAMLAEWERYQQRKSR